MSFHARHDAENYEEAREEMNDVSAELAVIAGAMLFFLVLCAVAVWLFVRQYRKEHKGNKTPRE